MFAAAGLNATRGNIPIERRMVYGINISGQEMGAVEGKLDVWIPVKKLAESTQVDEIAIRVYLESHHPPIGGASGDCRHREAGRLGYIERRKEGSVDKGAERK
jgi:hypothetical protein